MSWDPKAEDKMRRLLAQCEDPQAAIKWAPHLVRFCEELSARGAAAWKTGRLGARALLMEAAAFYAVRGQVAEFMRLLDPLLKDPSRDLLDDVYARMTAPLLVAGDLDNVKAAVGALLKYSKAKDDTDHWVAFARCLSGVINALYSMRRFSTADSYHRFFDEAPTRFRSLTAIYEAQALLDMAVSHSRDGESSQIANAVRDLAELNEGRSSDVIRRSYAAALVAWVPELLAREDLDACEAEGARIYELSTRYPEDVELAAEYLHFLAEGLPALLSRGRAAAACERWRDLHRAFPKAPRLAEKAGELVHALAEEHPDLLAAGAEALRPPLDELELRHGSASPLLAERCRQARRVAGLPPAPRGCLGLVLAGAALWVAA